MLLNCRLNTTQMLPERKEKQNQKDPQNIFAFRNQTNGQVYNESKFRHWQGITLKNDSLENKKATIHKCSTTFYLYQLILCFHYILGQPKFSIPLKVKCYYSEIIFIATITPVITQLFPPTYIIQTIGEHYLTHMTKNGLRRTPWNDNMNQQNSQ